MKELNVLHEVSVTPARFATLTELPGCALLYESYARVNTGDPFKVIEISPEDGTPTGSFAIRMITLCTKSRVRNVDNPFTTRYIIRIAGIS